VQKKNLVLTILLFCILIILISFAAVMTSRSVNSNTPVTERPPLKLDFAAWIIGDSEALTSFTNMANSHGAETAMIDLHSFESNSSLKSSVLNDRSLIVFDGNWLKQNDNQQLSDFLTAISKDVGGILVVGESKNNLYLALDKADICELSRDESGNIRFPVSEEDVAIVGFALKKCPTFSGEPYYVSSIFSTCSSTDSYGLMQAVVNWLNDTIDVYPAR
jgi:hypothetical protein